MYGPFDGQQGSRAAVLDGVEALGGGLYRATYHVTSAGGWTVSDNGTHTVKVRRRQVKDTNGVAAVASTLGTFPVQIGS